MKNILLISFLLLFSIVGKSANYYIATAANGGSNSNNGSVGSPWLTLKYACDNATTSGDVINVGVGTFAETAQSILRVGVSIVGQGNTSIITSTVVSTNGTIYAQSTMGTNGNQSISYIKMDGLALTAYDAILFLGRSNVSVHHCTFVDFYHGAVLFFGKADMSDGDPVTPATGNSVHDNTITNCSMYTSAGSGMVRVGGQTGMLIYNNTITQTTRGAHLNGYGIKYAGGGYNRGLKVYNNTISVPPWEAGSWSFSIEFWNNRGGVEVYGNTLQGGIDVAGVSEIDGDGYGYTTKIYNNTIGFAALEAYNQRGITIECSIDKIYIYNNVFRNLTTGIYVNQSLGGDNITNLNIYHNLFNGSGQSASNNSGYGIYFTSNINCNYINIINNTMYDGGYAFTTMCGVMFKDYIGGTLSNLVIRNNIIYGYNNSPVYIQDVTPDIVSVENNLFYGNGNSNAARYYLVTPTNKIEQNNLTADPLFITLGSNYFLQSTSTAINAGLANGYTTDIVGASIVGLPDIGAYESHYDMTVPVVTEFTIPSTATSLIVFVKSFTATDNVEVSKYLITSSASTPTVGDAGWSSTPQTQFVFTSGGAKTLYAWAKDAAGNISTAATAPVTITAPKMVISWNKSTVSW